MSEASLAPSPRRTARSGGNRDKLMMLAATGARMAVGLVTFILLARYLGPLQFGVIATAMAYTGLAGIATDFGLATSALRQAAARPEQAGAIVGDALAVKAMLALILAVAGGLFAWLVLPEDRLAIYAVVFVGAIAFSFADLAMVASRANRRFDIEAALVVSNSAIMLLVMGGVAAATHDVMAAALAFTGTRLIYLGAVWFGLRRWLGSLRGMRRSLASLRATLRESSSYAVDNILSTLSSQIDILLFGVVLSAHDVGIYQSGARLVQVIVPFAMVLSTVYMPGLSSAAINGEDEEFTALATKVSLEFGGLALLGGLAFALAGPIATDLLYGQRYDAVRPLWTGFGVFVMLRFAAAGYGIQLAALGHIRTRIFAQVAGALLFVAASYAALDRHGLSATSWLLALSALPSFCIYVWALWRAGRVKFVVPASAIALLAASGFLAVASVLMRRIL